MPTVDVEENIRQVRNKIQGMHEEIFRMQGILATFEGFKKAGLETINLPNDPNQPPVQELESIQEKPE